MTSIVTISAASQGVKANSEGVAEHAFSVTNIAAAQLGLGTRILVDAPAQESWFTIEGAERRELASNETDQIIIKAKLPAGTKPGDYKLRLQVYSTERGRAGEDFTNGPTVAVEMPEPIKDAEIIKRDDGFKWWIVALAAVIVLAVGGGVTWLLWPKDGIKMPEIVNKMTVDDARKVLRGVGLVNIKEEATQTAEVAPDFVVKQDPAAGTTMAKDTQVTLWVATPAGEVTISVPNVVRLPLEVAQQQLTATGLNVKKNPPVATIEFKAGEVTQQVPEAFSKVEPGSVVSLSIAGESVKVPTVKGDTLPAALTKMTAAKLLVKVTGDEDKLNQGVVSTTPAEGQVVLAGSEVTIQMPGQLMWIPVTKFPVGVLQQLRTTRGIQ